MKNLSLILFLLFLFPSCNDDAVDSDSKNLITENSTITIDESESDNCLFTILTENNVFYTTDNLPSEYVEIKFEAKIKYQLTGERKNCGFSGSLIKIKVTELFEI